LPNDGFGSVLWENVQAIKLRRDGGSKPPCARTRSKESWSASMLLRPAMLRSLWRHPQQAANRVDSGSDSFVGGNSHG